jgi:hypothetical protein
MRRNYGEEKYRDGYGERLRGAEGTVELNENVFRGGEFGADNN